MLPASRINALPKVLPSTTKSSLISDSARKIQIEEGMVNFPSDLVNLISGYDISLAAQPLRVDDRGNFIDDAENLRVRSAISEELTSRDGDPKIKRQIVVNVMQHGYQREFNKLVRELADSNMLINLEKTDLSMLVLKGLRIDFTVATEVNLSESILEDVSIMGAVLIKANLSGTTFRETYLNRSNLFAAQFEKTCFVRCSATGLTTNDTQLCNLSYSRLAGLYLNGTHSTKRFHLLKHNVQLTLPIGFFSASCVIC